MSIESIIELSLLFFLFSLSALFSGSEVAIFTLEKDVLKTHFGGNRLLLRYLSLMLDNSKRLLITILIGNNIVNTAASLVSVSIALRYAAQFGIEPDIFLVAQIAILTVLVLLFGEITPKIFAQANPFFFIRFATIPLYWISVLLYPVAETINEIIHFFAARIKFPKSGSAINEEELELLSKIGHERGSIDVEEHELIQGVVEYREKTVREIMRPRVDMASVSVGSQLRDIFPVILEEGHSRIPVFGKDIDDILGILYAKDLLPYLRSKSMQASFSLKKILRPVFHVPETKKISDLLIEFQQKKIHLAIAIDEYGGTAGLITLEDIIEEVVGDIHDEYDQEPSEITKLSENTFLVESTLPISKFEDYFDIQIQIENSDRIIDDSRRSGHENHRWFSDSAFDTIGGFVLDQKGDIPQKGFSFSFKNLTFTVQEVSASRIISLLVEKNDSAKNRT